MGCLMRERAPRTGWMLLLGAVLLVGLIGAAVALWVASDQRRADNVAGFARAPVGCDTTLDFEATGTFVLYLETSGEFGELPGECDAELSYDRDADDVAQPALTLLDPNGDALDFDEAGEVGYDVDGFIGSSTSTVQIETPGDHVLTVEPTAGDPFAVAIGRSPDEGVALLRWGAIAALISAVVLGGLFLVLGSRRPPAATPAADPWTPDGRGWPASPPGFPVPPPTTGATGPAGPALSPPGIATPQDRPAPPMVPDPRDDQPSQWGPPSTPQ